MITIPLSFNYNDDDLGEYYFDEQKITINPKVIQDSCSEYDSDFYTLLLHVINHEYLHHVIFLEQGLDACRDLDTLTNYRQTEKKNWDYWLS